MKRSLIKKPVLVAVACLGAIVAVAGGAYAYVAGGSGSGQGSAAVVSGKSVTIDALGATDNPSSKLVPGGDADVIVRVKNPNTFDVTLVSVTNTPDSSITAADASGSCSNTGVTFTDQPSLNVTIPAGQSTLVDLTGAAHMSTSSDSGCQGATFHIPVTIQVKK